MGNNIGKVDENPKVSQKRRNRAGVSIGTACGIAAFDTAAIAGAYSLLGMQLSLAVVGAVFAGTTLIMLTTVACCHAAADADDISGTR